MSILRLKPGQPVEIALKNRSFKLHGKNGFVEHELTLTTGQSLFVTPAGLEEIKSLNPSPGEAFSICKTIGPDEQPVYAVERVILDNAPPLPKPMAPARSIHAAEPEAVPPSLSTRESTRIFKQLVAAIEAAQAAEGFAKSIDYDLVFSSEDIRAMAISGFIEQSRTGRAA